jgi:predicted PurR-regulated permease PerM
VDDRKIIIGIILSFATDCDGAFGLIGIFLGPALLAVAYSLFLEWRAAEVEERRHPTPSPTDPD